MVGNKNLKAVSVAKGTEKIVANAFDLAKGVSSLNFPATLNVIEGNALDVTAWYTAQGDVVYAGPVLYKVKGEVSNITVKNGTTAIADNAVNNAAVKVVGLPATLVNIGAEAFAGSGITAIVIPANVKNIGVGAFRDTAVATVTFAANSKLESIESSAFKDCAKLAKISVPASVQVISSDTFAGCKALVTVDLGSAKEVEQYAFAGCEALNEITLPATVEAVDSVSFYGCTGLQAINVAEGNAKFKSVDGVVLVSNEAEEPVFDTIAIYPVGKAGEYKVPAEVKNIAAKAFYNCDAITGIVFESGFENIGAEAFYDCDNINSVSLPDSARNIGDYSFASCDELREFIVHSNLTDYADNAFDGCYYFNYDAVTINVEDNSSSGIIVVAIVLVAVGVVAYFVYNKKQKKLQQEIIEKNKIKEALEAQKTAE